MRVASCRTFQIPIAQAVAQIPAQTQHNNFTLEMAPLENRWVVEGCFGLRWFAVSGLTLSYPIAFCDRARHVRYLKSGKTTYEIIYGVTSLSTSLASSSVYLPSIVVIGQLKPTFTIVRT